MKLQIKPPEIYKGKSAAFFTPQEEEKLAKDCHTEDVCIAYGKKDPNGTFTSNAVQNIASSSNHPTDVLKSQKDGAKVSLGDVVTTGKLKNVVNVNNAKPVDISIPKEACSGSMLAGKSMQKEVNESYANISIPNRSQAPQTNCKRKQHENQQNFFFHKNYRHKNSLSR
ncbi:hypothetical protein HAX54_014474 [Datura stramonium]|uniref:Uncharacterized protein n=1 Tax=Datura stramonium TaxID=4076 RepID=A0ABS8RIQ8_DATST|nr:hypothetical protein [Datura stramonium]